MSAHETSLQLNQMSLVVNRKFPLLKLPRVVLLECIENLDVLEIILFSLLSKRAKSLAKCIRWSPLNILFDPPIRLRFTSDSGRAWIINYANRKSHPFLNFHSSSGVEETVYYHPIPEETGYTIKDSKEKLELICEVFRSPIHKMEINCQSLIDWIIRFQPIIRYVSIRDNVITSVETLDHVFKNLKVTEHFHLGSLAIDDTFRYAEPIPFRAISITDSSWLTLPSILHGTHSIVCLYGSKLELKDINICLKEWQLGNKLQNLEYMEIETTSFLNLDDSLDEVARDLNVTPSFQNNGRPMTV
ncbi:hypothetical protein B9Z55_012338 [Caenorhabditis nigoni]|nr:hypothetical protein B9Z55_012338 [Caenorhabditis nigoni]